MILSHPGVFNRFHWGVLWRLRSPFLFDVSQFDPLDLVSHGSKYSKRVFP